MYPLWKTVCSFLKKLKIELSYDLAIPLMDLYPKKNTNLKSYMHHNVPCSIIYNSQDLETTQMSINSWIDKADVINKYNEILLSHIKEWNLAIGALWKDLENIMLSEISERERQILYDIIYMWNLKHNANEYL